MFVNGVHKNCSKPEAVGNFHHGGAKSLRRSTILVNGEPRTCTEPETVGNFHHGGAQSLRRPTIFVNGMHKKYQSLKRSAISSWGCTEPEMPRSFREGRRTEPETVGNVHPGDAPSLRRPPIFVTGGAQSLRLSAIFIMVVHRA